MLGMHEYFCSFVIKLTLGQVCVYNDLMSKFNSGPMPLRHGDFPPLYIPPFSFSCNKSPPLLLLLPSPRRRRRRRPSLFLPPLLLLSLSLSSASSVSLPLPPPPRPPRPPPPCTLFSFPTFFSSCVLLLPPLLHFLFCPFLSSFPATRIDVP